MVFLVLFAQVWSEYRFNRNFEGYKNIYRFELPVKYDDTEYQYTHHSMRPVIEELEICSPGVLVACDYSDFELVMNRKAIVNENGSISKYDVPYAFADSSFPDVFRLLLTPVHVSPGRTYLSVRETALHEAASTLLKEDL